MNIRIPPRGTPGTGRWAGSSRRMAPAVLGGTALVLTALVAMGFAAPAATAATGGSTNIASNRPLTPSHAIAAATAQLCATPGEIAIQHFAFNPAVIPRGGESVATLTAMNCTNQSLSATETWVGYFVGPNGSVASGCPALDPLVENVAVPPNGTFVSSVRYTVPASCTATQLIVIADIYAGSGVPRVQGTAVLNIVTATG